MGLLGRGAARALMSDGGRLIFHQKPASRAARPAWPSAPNGDNDYRSSRARGAPGAGPHVQLELDSLGRAASAARMAPRAGQPRDWLALGPPFARSPARVVLGALRAPIDAIRRPTGANQLKYLSSSGARWMAGPSWRLRSCERDDRSAASRLAARRERRRPPVIGSRAGPALAQARAMARAGFRAPESSGVQPARLGLILVLALARVSRARARAN